MMQYLDLFDDLFALNGQSSLELTDTCGQHAVLPAYEGSQSDSSPATNTAGRRQRRAGSKSKPHNDNVQGKRKRHADAERERIHRKQTNVLRMRNEVAQLEQQLHSRSTSSSTGINRFFVQVTSAMDPSHSQLEGKVMSLLTPSEVRDLYVRALDDSGFLRRERALLQAKLDDCGLLEATVENLVKDLIDATTSQPMRPCPRDVVNAGVHQMPYRDVISNEYHGMMSDLVNESKQFTVHADASFSTNVGTNSLDWSTLCQHNGSDVRFSLTKSFPIADLDELMSSVWRAFHDVEVTQKIFSPTIRVGVLQRISDDILVVRWQINCRKNVRYVGHFRNLVFRWKTPDGYFVGCRTIDEIEPSDPPTKKNPTNGAFGQFYWAKFTQNPSGRGCQVTFAGRVGVGNGTSAFARILCTEIPISIFRWENMVVGPLFNFAPSVIV